MTQGWFKAEAQMQIYLPFGKCFQNPTDSLEVLSVYFEYHFIKIENTIEQETGKYECLKTEKVKLYWIDSVEILKLKELEKEKNYCIIREMVSKSKNEAGKEILIVTVKIKA